MTIKFSNFINVAVIQVFNEYKNEFMDNFVSENVSILLTFALYLTVIVNIP